MTMDSLPLNVHHLAECSIKSKILKAVLNAVFYMCRIKYIFEST